MRDLANHVIRENRWVPPMMAGRTVAEVGDAFDGDLLGDDPAAAWDEAAAEALAAVREPDAFDRTVHLSFGDHSGRYYIGQVLSDHVIHAWDLARAIGADEEQPRAVTVISRRAPAAEPEGIGRRDRLGPLRRRG